MIEAGEEFKEVDIAVSQENDNLLTSRYVDDLKRVVPFGSVAPTYVPKKMTECYYFYKFGSDKRLYLYIDNAWTYTPVTGGSGFQSAFGTGSHGAGGGTSNESFTCGFTPTSVKITAFPSGNYNSSSFGSHTGSTTSNLFNYTNGGTHTGSTTSSSIITIWDNSLTNNALASFVSFDANGFTIDWTSDTIGVVFHWEAYA